MWKASVVLTVPRRHVNIIGWFRFSDLGQLHLFTFYYFQGCFSGTCVLIPTQLSGNLSYRKEICMLLGRSYLFISRIVMAISMKIISDLFIRDCFLDFCNILKSFSTKRNCTWAGFGRGTDFTVIFPELLLVNNLSDFNEILWVACSLT